MIEWLLISMSPLLDQDSFYGPGGRAADKPIYHYSQILSRHETRQACEAEMQRWDSIEGFFLCAPKPAVVARSQHDDH